MKGINKAVRLLALPLLIGACSKKNTAPAIESPLGTEPAMSAHLTVELIQEIGFTPAQAAELISNRTNLATSLVKELEECFDAVAGTDDVDCERFRCD